jgi:hypothetical protein
VDPIMDGTGAELRASDRRSWRIKRLDDHTRRDRTLLHAYVMIGAFSGSDCTYKNLGAYNFAKRSMCNRSEFHALRGTLLQ